MFGDLDEENTFVITAYGSADLMTVPTPDLRGQQRRTRDEQIASESQLPSPDLAPGAATLPVEAHLARHGRPMAVAGIVENGLVRPLDPGVRLTERSRVIVVASEG